MSLVLLEPYIRRLETSIIFHRLMRHADAGGHLPDTLLAYRRELPTQHAALLLRCLVCSLLSDGQEVCLAD